eukprot:3643821-Rhodomonas_salina.2
MLITSERGCATPFPTSKTIDIEKKIDHMTSVLPPLEDSFIGWAGETVARIHMARAICSRVERALSASAIRIATVSAYVNRLSDFLFTLGRWVQQENEGRGVTSHKQDQIF